MPADQRAPTPDALTILAEGEMEIQGRMPWSSNRTFLVTVSLDGVELAAIYKPGRGERPLWDFPSGLYQREVAAYLLFLDASNKSEIFAPLELEKYLSAPAAA